MSEADARHITTRRGFLGHVAGAYTAVAIAAAPTAPELAALIRRHRETLEAFVALDEERDPDAVERRECARILYERACGDLLDFRPTTVEAAREKFEFLFSPEGPFCCLMLDASYRDGVFGRVS